MAFLRRGASTWFRLSAALWVAVWLVAILEFLPALGRAVEAPSTSPEYQIKAVFLFNFAQFVQWPSKAFRDPRAPLVIGVLGDDPFGAYLDKLTVGEKIGDHPFELQRFRGADDFSACHILFISRSEANQLDKILARLKGRNILTVSDAENFSRRGGMIRFVTENGKIRLRVNVVEAKEAQLTISSKLLRPATIVTRDRD